jgi:hypothetical protein
MVLNKEILTQHKAVGIAIPPFEARYGYEDPNKALAALSKNHVILQGTQRVYELQVTYLRGYASNSTVSLRQYRDLLLSLALGKLIRNAQCRDSEYTTLTTHADRWWSKHSFSEAWNIDLEADLDTEDSATQLVFGGPLGSLAYLLLKHNLEAQTANPVELCTSALELFWADEGIPYETTSPNKRLDLILKDVGLDQIDWVQWQLALDRLDQTPLSEQPPEANQIIIPFRQALLNSGDYDNLQRRLLLGEFNPAIVETLDLLLDLVETSEQAAQFYGLAATPIRASALTEKLEGLWPPAGSPMIFVSYLVEAYSKAAQIITEAPDLDLDIKLTNFLSASQHAELRMEIALWLALAYDAWSMLGIYQTLYEAMGQGYRSYLAALQMVTYNKVAVIPMTAPTRLRDI